MSPVDIPLATFGFIVAVMLWSALAFMISTSRRANHWLTRFGLMAVTTVGALLWTTSTFMRVTNTMNVYLINAWSRIFYAMFAFYALGFALITWWVIRKVKRVNE